ncbi:hypothetical protein SAMN06265371_104101 [Lutibacter agarilyticus]|uniref:Uncharacterized protein n=1 Tax=Lutibacter agarilyticus TaxID=1109740 RepID=A0A238WW59_9FLAO|nr:hypothetical protein [Lutibacter agarilyticus]SNR50683.1 hypothetical protein SAMN06265371_104101 [Lutibacter agarilyticus]
MNNNLEHRFKNLENEFDIEEPTIGHFNRFEAKLNTPKSNSKSNLLKFIATFSIAASIILFVGIWIGSEYSSKGMELAGISTEMQETQSYFVNTIHKELQTIEKERNNTNKKVINDGLKQLEKLETQYQVLTLELKESTGDKRIIYAMISNFQQRIDLLQSILFQIETIKQLKTEDNEKYV